MKMLLLIFLLSITVFAQRKETSVCAEGSATAKPAVLTICNFGKGMTGLPRLRLYLRVYADGTAEYEENGSNFTLVKHKLKVSAERVAQIVKLGTAADFQSAKTDYPVFQIWTDSGLETTVTFRDKEREKKIVVRNYRASDKDNGDDKNYPASLVALLRLTDEIRNPKPVIKEPVVSKYNRILEVGKTYRGKVNFGSAYGMTLTPFPKLPYHHSVLYSWPNVKDFPELDPDKNFGLRTIVFKVLDKEVDNFRKNNWITTFTIAIVRVE